MRETKKLSKRPPRWALWTFVCATASIAIFLSVDYAKNRDFRQAAEWHKVHGNVILVDGHKITLPPDWWEKNYDEGEKRVIVKASRSLTKVFSSGIVFDRKKPEESKISENDVRKNLEFLAEKERKWNHAPVSSMIVVRAASTNIYCLQTPFLGQDVSLRCNVTGTPIVISSVGSLDTEKEIEAILSTFE